MSRDLTVAFATALADQNLRPVIFFEGQFATGWVRIWSGLGAVTWNGQAWAGAGSLLGLGSLDETGEVVAGGTAVSLSGADATLVASASGIAGMSSTGAKATLSPCSGLFGIGGSSPLVLPGMANSTTSPAGISSPAAPASAERCAPRLRRGRSSAPSSPRSVGRVAR